MDSFAQLLDEEVYIITSPIIDIRKPSPVTLEVLLVGNGLSCSRIGIEVIVNMESVDIVTAHNIIHHRTDVIAILR